MEFSGVRGKVERNSPSRKLWVPASNGRHLLSLYGRFLLFAPLWQSARVIHSIDPASAARARSLAEAALARAGAPRELPSRLLVVDVERQTATWFENAELMAAWRVSTARAGIGGEQGSYRTPPGWHRVHRKIGDGAPPGAVFVAREPTGDAWGGEVRADDLILTRILTLEGLEDGVNRGEGRDSLQRYIYVHGTNQECLLGRTQSHGCVRMANDDVCDLFVRIREGDYVLIAEPAMRTIPDPQRAGRFHYAGLGGSGMSALAQFQVMSGGRASGSDRAFVASLMGRVVEPGKFANWIAPPNMGINKQPVDFQYVRFN